MTATTPQPTPDLGALREDSEKCADFDHDCFGIGSDGRGFASHLDCWLHDPTKGVCPFLDRRAALHGGKP
jgi:hypothetical protein